MNSNRSILLLGLFLAVLWVGGLACPTSALAKARRSAAGCDVVEYSARPVDDVDALRRTPPNPDGPTRVGVGFDALDIRDVVPVQGSFKYRGYVRTSWCDPRLAFEGSAPRIFTGGQVEEQLGQIWSPQGYPSNQLGDLELTERVMRLYPDGTVLQDINVAVRLATRYDLRRFPFDEQVLSLQVESYVWDRDAVEMVVDDSMSGSGSDLELPEWTIVGVTADIDEVERMRGDTPFSRYTMRMRIARDPGFYLWKVFLPLCIIVALSWSVFWMTEEKLASRSRITATGILTIVAYQFVFAGDLPRIGYLTILDKVMIWSFGMLAVTVLQSMLVTHKHDDAPQLAKRIDRISRWLFPCVYAAIITLIVSD